MKTENIPSMVMLTAGLADLIVAFLKHFSINKTLTTLLCVMILFYLLGKIIKLVLDKVNDKILVAKEQSEKENEEDEEAETEEISTEEAS